MEKRKKIGLITIFHVPNYGSVLQAYATQYLIEKLGFQCVMLNYRYPNKWHINQDPRRKRSLKSKIALLLGVAPAHRKSNKLARFRKSHYHFSKEYDSLDSLKTEDWSDYDAFVVGSDQVWNARFTLSDSAFLLSFIPDNKVRISLASSFSSDHIPDAFEKKYKRYLEKFQYLSVREKNGKSIIENDLCISKEVEIVLDPTLLLSQEEWVGLFAVSTSKSARIKKEKYILLYLLTYAFESRPYVFEVVKHFQKKYGYKVIALEGYTLPGNALGVNMENQTDVGIEQYINLIAHAEMVITTSFHGAAFAVNFGIPLVSIVPKQQGDDRQSSLLNALELQQCIVPVANSIDEINPFYKIDKAKEKLWELREKSLFWISQVFSNM